jgi:hypothetical protein
LCPGPIAAITVPTIPSPICLAAISAITVPKTQIFGIIVSINEKYCPDDPKLTKKV